MRKNVEKKDKQVQTIIRCFPHLLLSVNDTAKVCSVQGCQTVTSIIPSSDNINLYPLLEFIPYQVILENSKKQLDLPRKVLLQWNLNDSSTSSKISLTDKQLNCEESDSLPQKGVLKKIPSSLSITFRNRNRYRDKMEKSVCHKETQTVLFVSPHILDNDELANVFTELSVQTSITCLPNDSISNILDQLKGNLSHSHGMQESASTAFNFRAENTPKIAIEDVESIKKNNSNVLTDEQLGDGMDEIDRQIDTNVYDETYLKSIISGPNCCDCGEKILNIIVNKLRTKTSSFKFTQEDFTPEINVQETFLEILNTTIALLQTQMPKMEYRVEENKLSCFCVGCKAQIQQNVVESVEIGATEINEVASRQTENVAGENLMGDNFENKNYPCILCECHPSQVGAAPPMLSLSFDSPECSSETPTDSAGSTEQIISQLDVKKKISNADFTPNVTAISISCPNITTSITVKQPNIQPVASLSNLNQKDIKPAGIRRSEPIESEKRIEEYIISEYRNQVIADKSSISHTKTNITSSKPESITESNCRSKPILPRKIPHVCHRLLNSDEDKSTGIQTDLTLGNKLQSESLNSINNEKGEHNSKMEIPWQTITLQAPGSYNIKLCDKIYLAIEIKGTEEKVNDKEKITRYENEENAKISEPNLVTEQQEFQKNLSSIVINIKSVTQCPDLSKQLPVCLQPNTVPSSIPCESQSCTTTNITKTTSKTRIKNFSSMPSITDNNDNVEFKIFIERANQPAEEVCNNAILNSSEKPLIINVPDEPINVTLKMSVPQNQKKSFVNLFGCCPNGSKPDQVVAALEAYEAEMRPLRDTLRQLQQKIKNLNLSDMNEYLSRTDPIGQLTSITTISGSRGNDFKSFDSISYFKNVKLKSPLPSQLTNNSVYNSQKHCNKCNAQTYYDKKKHKKLSIAECSCYSKPCGKSNIVMLSNTYEMYPNCHGNTYRNCFPGPSTPYENVSSELSRAIQIYKDNDEAQIFSPIYSTDEILSRSSRNNTLTNIEDKLYTQEVKQVSCNVNKTKSKNYESSFRNKIGFNSFTSCESCQDIFNEFLRAGPALKTDPDEVAFDSNNFENELLLNSIFPESTMINNDEV